MPDRGFARQFRNHRGRKNLLYVPHRLVDVQLCAIRRRNPRGLLPAMLQRVQAQIRHLRRFGVPENSEHAAMIVKVIVFDGVRFTNHSVSIAFCSDSDQGF